MVGVFSPQSHRVVLCARSCRWKRRSGSSGACRFWDGVCGLGHGVNCGQCHSAQRGQHHEGSKRGEGNTPGHWCRRVHHETTEGVVLAGGGAAERLLTASGRQWAEWACRREGAFVWRLLAIRSASDNDEAKALRVEREALGRSLGDANGRVDGCDFGENSEACTVCFRGGKCAVVVRGHACGCACPWSPLLGGFGRPTLSVAFHSGPVVQFLLFRLSSSAQPRPNGQWSSLQIRSASLLVDSNGLGRGGLRWSANNQVCYEMCACGGRVRARCD